MAAKKGNKYHEKFKTPAARQAAFKAFCDHLSAGYSAKSFHDPCVENTILKMLVDYPHEFDASLLSAAKARSCEFWEKIGMAGVSGKLKNFNAGAWIFNMKNRMGWKDKTEISGDPENPLPVGNITVNIVPVRPKPKGDDGKKL